MTFKQLIQPDPGHRTYMLLILCLLMGGGLAFLGIMKGVTDLLGLGLVIGAVTSPIAGAQVWKSIGTSKTRSGKGK